MYEFMYDAAEFAQPSRQPTAAGWIHLKCSYTGSAMQYDGRCYLLREKTTMTLNLHESFGSIEIHGASVAADLTLTLEGLMKNYNCHGQRFSKQKTLLRKVVSSEWFSEDRGLNPMLLDQYGALPSRCCQRLTINNSKKVIRFL